MEKGRRSVEFSVDDRLETGFFDFLEREQISQQELWEAYQIFLGVSDIAEQDASEHIQRILQEMRAMEGQGFPVNRYARLIAGMRNRKDPPGDFLV